jgi:hypothetical protein
MAFQHALSHSNTNVDVDVMDVDRDTNDDEREGEKEEEEDVVGVVDPQAQSAKEWVCVRMACKNTYSSNKFFLGGQLHPQQQTEKW